MNAAPALLAGIVDALPRPHERKLSIDLRSDTVSWPHLFVPEYRGSLAGYAKWWRNYFVWHAKVVGREVRDAFFRGLEVLVPAWILFTIGYSSTIRNNKLQAIIDAIDAGSGGGLEKWYDGSRPATGGTATTLLGTLTFSTTSATKSGGVLTFNSITGSNAVATSTVTWGRVSDDTATFCFDHSIATSAADIIVNAAAISTGAALSITSWTITDGNP